MNFLLPKWLLNYSSLHTFVTNLQHCRQNVKRRKRDMKVLHISCWLLPDLNFYPKFIQFVINFYPKFHLSKCHTLLHANCLSKSKLHVEGISLQPSWYPVHMYFGNSWWGYSIEWSVHSTRNQWCCSVGGKETVSSCRG